MRPSEIGRNLWRWELPHPDWVPEEAEDDGWEEVVASYALFAGDLVLLDPLAPEPGSPEGDAFWRALDDDVQRHGPPAVLLTIHWHARSAATILERYPGASVRAYEPARDLVSERTPVTHVFAAGEELPGGVVAYDAGRRLEVAFWLPSHRALVAGDALLGGAPGEARICPEHWAPEGWSRDDVRRALRPLLDLPVELLLLTHGDVIADDARGALERALA
jgi:glyoxylase-like metal-dependent hydrolase (beta-lactamase superfamily II)